MDPNDNPCPHLYMGENNAVVDKLKEIMSVLSTNNNDVMCDFLLDRRSFLENYMRDHPIGGSDGESDMRKVINRLCFNPYLANFDANLTKTITAAEYQSGRVELTDFQVNGFQADGEPFANPIVVSGHIDFKEKAKGDVIKLSLDNRSQASFASDLEQVHSNGIIYAVTLEVGDATEVTFRDDIVLLGPEQPVDLFPTGRGGGPSVKPVFLNGYINALRGSDGDSPTVEIYLKFREPAEPVPG